MIPFLYTAQTLAIMLASYVTLLGLLLIWVGLGGRHWIWRVLALEAWLGLLLLAQWLDLAIVTGFMNRNLVRYPVI
jgi:hypothetical protein